MELPSWGSYENWSAIVRGTLVWVGLPDPATHRMPSGTAVDPERAALETACLEWPRLGVHGCTACEAIRAISAEPDKFRVLADAISHLVPGELTPRRLGMALGRYVDRVVAGGWRFKARTTRLGHSARSGVSSLPMRNLGRTPSPSVGPAGPAGPREANPTRGY